MIYHLVHLYNIPVNYLIFLHYRHCILWNHTLAWQYQDLLYYLLMQSEKRSTVFKNDLFTVSINCYNCYGCSLSNNCYSSLHKYVYIDVVTWIQKCYLEFNLNISVIRSMWWINYFNPILFRWLNIFIVYQLHYFWYSILFIYYII